MSIKSFKSALKLGVIMTTRNYNAAVLKQLRASNFSLNSFYTMYTLIAC